MGKSYKSDIVPGIVLIAFSICYLALIPTVSEFVGLGSTPLTNHFVPELWGGVLLFLGIWIFVRGLRKRKRFLAEGGIPEKGTSFWNSEKEVVESFIALKIYVALMTPVGFVISTIFYITVQILILTKVELWKKTWLPALITGVVFGVALDYIFKVFLNVLLPTGILGW